MDTLQTTATASRRFLDQRVSSLCWPAFAYLIVAAFVFLTGIMSRTAAESVVLVVAMALMTWLLNALCQNKQVGLSWAVLIAMLSGVVILRWAALLVGVIAVL